MVVWYWLVYRRIVYLGRDMRMGAWGMEHGTWARAGGRGQGAGMTSMGIKSNIST